MVAQPTRWYTFAVEHCPARCMAFHRERLAYIGPRMGGFLRGVGNRSVLQAEPGEYVAGQEGIAHLAPNRLIWRCMQPSPVRFLGSTGQTCRVPAWKYSASLRFISALVLFLLKISTARSELGIGLPGRSRPGSLSQEVNAASGMSTWPEGDKVAVVGKNTSP